MISLSAAKEYPSGTLSRAAHPLNATTHTLARRSRSGKFPTPTNIDGRSVRYSPTAIELRIKQQEGP